MYCNITLKIFYKNILLPEVGLEIGAGVLITCRARVLTNQALYRLLGLLIFYYCKCRQERKANIHTNHNLQAFICLWTTIILLNE